MIFDGAGLRQEGQIEVGWQGRRARWQGVVRVGGGWQGAR